MLSKTLSSSFTVTCYFSLIFSSASGPWASLALRTVEWPRIFLIKASLVIFLRICGEKRSVFGVMAA